MCYNVSMIFSKKRQSFLSRLIINGLLFYLAVWLFSPGYLNSLNSIWDAVMAFAIISIIFSILNALVKPILILLTLPAMFLTLGIFSIVINGLIVFLTAAIVPNLVFTLWNAILAGLIISTANYLITNLFWDGD